MKTSKKILIGLLAVFLIAIFTYNFWQNNSKQCSRVFTFDETLNLDKWKQKDILMDDDFALNSCEGDNWSCSNFCTQEDAQKILEACNSVDLLDINQLDQDEDGIACESIKQ